VLNYHQNLLQRIGSDTLSAYTRLERVRYIGPKKGILVLYNLFLRKIDRIQKRTALLSRPISLQIESTTRCNLKCMMCDSPVWDRRGMDMKFSDFKKIIDQFPFLTSVNLQGIGEPLLNNDIFKMIEYCKSKKIMVLFTTNATLIDDAVAKKIVDSGLDYIVISVDGATSETFEKIRIGANFDQVMTNIKKLVAASTDSKKPRIIFHFCATNDNIEELPQVLKLAKDIGAYGVESLDVIPWGKDYLKEKLKDKTLSSNIGKAKKIINEAKIEADRMGIKFFWWGHRMDKLYSDSDLQLHADPRLCQQPFRSCFITVDGYVTRCSDIPDPRISNFGNILEQDFDDIWNNSEYRALRKAFLEGKLPDLCKECTKPMGIR
jgi:radical SAM protein with 4Fe4S-binding SPASM domain